MDCLEKVKMRSTIFILKKKPVSLIFDKNKECASVKMTIYSYAKTL